MKLEEQILQIIAHILEVDVEVVEMDTAIGDLVEWDSLHHLQIIAELEKTFSIKFKQEDLAELEDVSDLVALVEEMQGE